MIVTWIFGIVFCLLGIMMFLKKCDDLTKYDENFKDLKDKMMKEDDGISEDTSISLGGIALIIIAPYINIIFGMVFWGLVFVPSMWNSFIEYLFEKF